MQQLFTYLAQWNKTRDSFAKLQAAYAALAIGLVVVAGIVGLLNSGLGRALAFYAFISLLVFIGNGVLWAIIKTFIIPVIEKNAPAPKTRKK